MFSKHRKKRNGNTKNTLVSVGSGVFDNLDEGIVVLDNEYNICIFNPGAEKLTGWAAKDAIGLYFNSVINVIDEQGRKYSENTNPIKRALIERNTISVSKAKLFTLSEQQTIIDIITAPIINDDDSLQGAVSILKDSAHAHNSRESAMTEFMSTASHEMRTPIAAIDGFLELALNSQVCNIDDNARSYLEKAQTSASNLSRLFQDLLTSSQSEDGQLVNNPAIVEMVAFVQEITEASFSIAEKKQLVVKFLVGTGEVGGNNNSLHAAARPVHPTYYAYVDPNRLQEVFNNLFDNAVKYTNEGEIIVTIDANENTIQIKIEDTGIGIAPENVPHLFEKFYRVNSSATQTVSGTGLGLFICKQIVQLYSGQIRVESILGKGSAFYVMLPRMSKETAQKVLDQQLILSDKPR